MLFMSIVNCAVDIVLFVHVWMAGWLVLVGRTHYHHQRQIEEISQLCKLQLTYVFTSTQDPSTASCLVRVCVTDKESDLRIERMRWSKQKKVPSCTPYPENNKSVFEMYRKCVVVFLLK